MAAGATITGVIDGGPGGYDTLNVGGGTVVSNPSDAHSGTLIVDGQTITYTGLEPITSAPMSFTFNGADAGGSQQLLDKDLITVQPDPNVSGNILIRDCLITGCSGTIPDLAESQSIATSGLTSLTINGGLGTDTVEFIGGYTALGSTLTVNAETIKVDPGAAINLGTGNIAFNAIVADDGLDSHGIDTTLTGDTATIAIGDPATPGQGGALTGGSVALTATAENAQTTVKGQGSNDVSLGTLKVATSDPFLSSGKFTIAGISGVCSFSGTSGHNQFTGVTGCSGTPADGALVTSLGIIESGSTTLLEHSALQLIYGASVNVNGASTITSTGDVTLASTVNVIGTANGQPVNWVAAKDYSKGDTVIDTVNGKLYSAKADITAANDTTAPSSDSSDWADATGQNAALAASSLVATATSQLSGTSAISASGGNVKITSAITSNITTNASASLSGSGAGIAVAVVVTDSEAFIDSTAATPVLAKNVTVSADTNNTAPTTGQASAGGASSGGSGTDATKPSSVVPTSNSAGNAASTKGDNQSKTSDGDQKVAAALGVTVLVATTKAYIASSGGGSTTISTSGGTQLVHAGATNNATSTADAGNVKFSPDAPKATILTVGGTLADSQTLYYVVTALSSVAATTVNGAGQNLAGSTLVVADTTGFDPLGKVSVVVGATTVVCSYTSITGNTLNGLSGCSGTPANGAAVNDLHESMASPETKVDIPSASGTNSVKLTWANVPAATSTTVYQIYRSATSGAETLLATVPFAASPTYTDTQQSPPVSSVKPPDADPSSGVGIAVGVTVAVVNTKAYVGNNANLVASTVTVEIDCPVAVFVRRDCHLRSRRQQCRGGGLDRRPRCREQHLERRRRHNTGGGGQRRTST